jgi:hypothetical protein
VLGPSAYVILDLFGVAGYKVFARLPPRRSALIDDLRA